MIKQIFQANEELMKKYPFHRGFFMSDEKFQIDVVSTVYNCGQTFLERAVGNTIYKNYVGFVKGKVGEMLSLICKNGKFSKHEMAFVRAYGIRYINQYLNLIGEEKFKKFEENYEKYASKCKDVEMRIKRLINAENVSKAQKEALNKEIEKLYGISKVENVEKNVEKIVSNDNKIQMEFNF